MQGLTSKFYTHLNICIEFTNFGLPFSDTTDAKKLPPHIPLNDTSSSISPEKEGGIAIVSAKAATPLSQNVAHHELINFPSQEFNVEEAPICKIHDKPIEAFCQEDNCLVCIDCILSNDHKGHTLHAIDKAIDLQITYIGKQNEKAKELRVSINKQRKELAEKFDAVIESCNSKREEVAKFFNDIKEIIAEKEQKMVKEVDEKVESTNSLFSKKLETLDAQEEFIGRMEDMMNIHIEENVASKLAFLNE